MKKVHGGTRVYSAKEDYPWMARLGEYQSHRINEFVKDKIKPDFSPSLLWKSLENLALDNLNIYVLEFIKGNKFICGGVVVDER